MKTLLVLQLVYLAFALGYNVVSYVLVQSTGTGLAQTSPIFGFVAVSLIPGLCTVIGWTGRMQIHAILAIFVGVVFCLVGGALPHVRAFIAGDLSNYWSVTSLFAAASLNFTGATIYLMSAQAAWKMRHATNSPLGS